MRDPNSVITSNILRKVREIKSARQEVKQNRQLFIDEITDVQQRLTALEQNNETFNTNEQYLRYRAFLEKQHARLNRNIINSDNKIETYNARIRRAQIFAPFDDISLDDD